MLDDLNSYNGILIDGINEIVDNNVPIYSSNLWAEAPYLEEYINEVLASNKEYETILDVISIKQTNAPANIFVNPPDDTYIPTLSVY